MVEEDLPQQPDGESSAEDAGEAEQLSLPQQPARALIGWLPAEQGQLVLAGRRSDLSGQPEHEERARHAREAVAARAVGLDQTDAISDPPPELQEHIDALQGNESTAPLFAEGQEVRLIRLSRICSIQPVVHSAAAENRVAAVDTEDLRSVADISLPIPGEPTPIPAQFDETRQTWILSSANPNFRIVGQFQATAEQGIKAYGFAVRVMPSFVRVGLFQGRYILLDGYHRSYGFLRQGIDEVPAFVRQYNAIEEMQINAGMLPQAAYLGDRPALLSDFLDDAVAADVTVPAAQKMIVIQGLEITPLG
jgi:hypothetical protein